MEQLVVNNVPQLELKLRGYKGNARFRCSNYHLDYTPIAFGHDKISPRFDADGRVTSFKWVGYDFSTDDLKSILRELKGERVTRKIDAVVPKGKNQSKVIQHLYIEESPNYFIIRANGHPDHLGYYKLLSKDGFVRKECEVEGGFVVMKGSKIRIRTGNFQRYLASKLHMDKTGIKIQFLINMAEQLNKFVDELK